MTETDIPYAVFLIAMILFPLAVSPLSVFVFWMAAHTATNWEVVGAFAFLTAISNVIMAILKAGKADVR